VGWATENDPLSARESVPPWVFDPTIRVDTNQFDVCTDRMRAIADGLRLSPRVPVIRMSNHCYRYHCGCTPYIFASVVAKVATEPQMGHVSSPRQAEQIYGFPIYKWVIYPSMTCLTLLGKPLRIDGWRAFLEGVLMLLSAFFQDESHALPRTDADRPRPSAVGVAIDRYRRPL
jgi:hypothetical protein